MANAFDESNAPPEAKANPFDDEQASVDNKNEQKPDRIDQAIRQTGLTSRDLLNLSSGLVTGPADLVNTGVNFVTSGLNKNLGTKIPQLGMPSENVNDAITKYTGLPEAESKSEKLGSLATQLAGGAAMAGESLVPAAKAAASKVGSLFDSLSSRANANGIRDYSDFRKWADKVGLDIKGKTPQEVQDSLINYFSTATEKAQKAIAGGEVNFNPIQANREISKAYEKEIEHSSNLYAGVKAGFRDTAVPDNGLSEDLNSLITELKSTPEVGAERTGTSVATRDLEDIQKKLQSKPVMGYPEKADKFGVRSLQPVSHELAVNDLIDLKKSLNQHYDPKVFRTSGDAPYARLSAKIDDLIAQAGKKNPQAYRAYEAANEHWAEDVAKRFTNNDVLKQFWRPEDLNNSYKNKWMGTPAANEIGKGVHPNTALRAESFLKKINSPVDLEIVANSVDPQYAKMLFAHKYGQLAKEIGMDASKLTPERLALMEKSLGKGYGAVQARQILNNMREVLEMLQQRNINGPYTKAELMVQSKNLAQRVSSLWHSIAAAKTGAPMSVLRHAGDALTAEEAATGAANKMNSLRKDYNKLVKPPKTTYSPIEKAIGTGQQ